MKIKTQFNLLIFGIVFIPFVSIATLPIYHYFTSPQRYLLKGYKEIHSLNNIDFTENDWNELKYQLRIIPRDVQTAVYYDSTILISTMPELKAGSFIPPVAFFEFIHSTSDEYDYQVQSPILVRKNKSNEYPERKKVKFLVLSRFKVEKPHKPQFQSFYIPAFIILLVFEAFCITVIIHISYTVGNSITLLEQCTLKIANGALDTKIDLHKTRKSNEIISLSESLEKMRVSLKDDQERRTKFIMGISHDLRTPVAIIKGYTEAIIDGIVTNTDAIKKSLAIILSKTDLLETMINDLMNYVKLNNTDWRQTLETVPIMPFLENFAKMAETTAYVYKRTIQTSINISPTQKTAMDKNLFNRALENLFSNALRYTKDGDKIFIEGKETDKDILISIADTGEGIEQKDFEHLYDLFYRGTSSRRESGMGIGLSVVKTIIDTHGWYIDVESQIKKGTKFTITIPK